MTFSKRLAVLVLCLVVLMFTVALPARAASGPALGGMISDSVMEYGIIRGLSGAGMIFSTVRAAKKTAQDFLAQIDQNGAEMEAYRLALESAQVWKWVGSVGYAGQMWNLSVKVPTLLWRAMCDFVDGLIDPGQTIDLSERGISYVDSITASSFWQVSPGETYHYKMLYNGTVSDWLVVYEYYAGPGDTIRQTVYKDGVQSGISRTLRNCYLSVEWSDSKGYYILAYYEDEAGGGVRYVGAVGSGQLIGGDIMISEDFGSIYGDNTVDLIDRDYINSRTGDRTIYIPVEGNAGGLSVDADGQLYTGEDLIGRVIGDGSIDVINDHVDGVPYDVAEGAIAVEGELSIPASDVYEMIRDRIGVGPLRSSMQRLLSFNTSQVEPPVIKLNLAAIFNAATDRFGNPSSPFPDRETVFIDFGMLNDYEIGGVPLIEYFRMIIGFGFLWMTFLYVWHKLIPKEVVA